MRSTASAARALADVACRPCARCRLQAAAAAASRSSVVTSPLTRPSPRGASHSIVAAHHPSSSPPLNHYDIFPETLPLGPPPRGHFPIDVRALRREFLRLQARHHPDMHHHHHHHHHHDASSSSGGQQGPGTTAKARAEATSALINEAYKTLSNPLLRAQYLLSLRGVDVATDETMQVDDPSLLALVLEAHEEISDAEREEDLAALRRTNDERIRQSEEVLERAFREDDVQAAKREAVRLRYWVNIKESLDNWEEGRPVVLQH
ncbi:Co-chaperone Hsc20 [Trichoderma citrinoviride]|uniref:Co-chaperone Hsc20 n=1 Tax=Trichoderma citrinoviride TaxID=58853 RepID=A0A2T4BCN4_9HYPO|nr:Co-chaperone Hsc20 [Trichoderma citrinoviride]PTB67093.1 Co-chaperone Hsc20 [Trichoderma citrinoviride]